MGMDSKAREQQASLQTASFGEINFGAASLGDHRRTKRLVRVADTLVRHPGGSLPEKMRSPAELEALYHLMKGETVTHESVMAPHRNVTLKKIAEHVGPVVVIHDTTELDYTNHKSLKDMGQIGNGSRRGWLCHNSLVVDPQTREVIGLSNQIVHRRPIVPKKETVAQKRDRENRESRLWLQGTEQLPSNRKIVDVCDRGGDTFEFLEHETLSGRTFAVRSTYNRSIVPGHVDSPGEIQASALLHDFARTLPSLGQWTLSVPAAKLQKSVKTGKGKSRKSMIIDREARDAVLHVSAAPIRLRPPKKNMDSMGMNHCRSGSFAFGNPTRPRAWSRWSGSCSPIILSPRLHRRGMSSAGMNAVGLWRNFTRRKKLVVPFRILSLRSPNACIP